MIGAPDESADELRTDSKLGPATKPDRAGLVLFVATDECVSGAKRGDFLTFPLALDLDGGGALLESGTAVKVEAGGGQLPTLFCLRAEVHSNLSSVMSPVL